MKHLSTITVFLCLIEFSNQVNSQVFENNYVWHTQDHSAWKVEPSSPFGYVIAGNKFFEPGNTDIYLTGFDEFGGHLWTRSHASGLSSLQTFWKSFVKIGSGSGYFVACAGSQGSTKKAYGLIVNSYGMKFWDRISDLPYGIEFGGVTNAVDGGFVATGGTNTGQFAVVKFDEYGSVVWARELPVSGFGWTIAPSVGGGYVIAGGMTAAKVSNTGIFEWSSDINLPASPSGSYSYGEFEEITKTADGGYIVTGSCFSNSHSGVYTALVNYNGSVAWAKVVDAVNTSLAGTPVCWVNNAILDQWGASILTSWRRGPVSTGGTMYYQRLNFSGNNIGGINSIGNTIPVQEAFMTKAHGKYVIGGTRGSYRSAYSCVVESLSVREDEGDDRNLIQEEETDPMHRIQTSVFHARPIFEYPLMSRRFGAEMRVFPNPSNGQIYVGGAVEPGALLRIISPVGTILQERVIGENETLLQLDLNNPAAGLYTVEMIGSNGSTSRKVIIE